MKSKQPHTVVSHFSRKEVSRASTLKAKPTHTQRLKPSNLNCRVALSVSIRNELVSRATNTEDKTMVKVQMSGNQHVYRTAIAINNIGCSLLDRGCFPQAHSTLTDAAQVMVRLTQEGDDVAASPPTTSECGADHFAQKLDLISKLQSANQRHALSMLSAPTLSPPSCPSALRLEAEEYDADQTADLFLMSAISVHNMALSCLCQSVDPALFVERRDRLRNKSVALLKSSYRLIREGENSTWTPQSVKVAIHILESLTHVLSMSGTTPEEESTQRKFITELAGLRSAVQTMTEDSNLHILPGTSGLAPAA